MNIEDNMRIKLAEKLGNIVVFEEWIPGVYYFEADQGKRIGQEFCAVLDTAPLAAKVQNYGKKMDGLRLFAQADNSSGFRIVQYEISKYSITVKKSELPETTFRDASLHAIELHPEYFGMFPVPFHTPHGYTLRHHTLANGIYWLETSMCNELLAVCHPVWNAELSLAAQLLCEEHDNLLANAGKHATDYMFFSKEASSIPVFELMERRREWDGTVIDSHALMNAIWECLPQYAMHMDGEKNQEFEAAVSVLMAEAGINALPEPHGDRMVYMYPEAGTEFLLLK